MAKSKKPEEAEKQKKKYNYTKKTGKPEFEYSDELAVEICDAISCTSESLTKICERNPHFPKQDTIIKWRVRNSEFSELYLAAKRSQAMFLADEIIAISDAAHGDVTTDEYGNEKINSEFVARSKLRIDARKWAAARLAPKIYGDRPTQESAPATQADIQGLQSAVAELIKKNEKPY